jgi:hypothetical protein
MRQRFVCITLFGIVLIFTASCGSRFGDAEPTPTIAPVPTFTPTPASDASGEALPPEPAPTAEPLSESADDEIATVSSAGEADPEGKTADQPTQDSAILLPTPTDTVPPADAVSDAPAPAPTSTPVNPMLTISAELINVRSGPSTNFAQVATANGGDEFTLIGRNEVGDWWQVCCFAEQPGWIYGPLAEVKNAESVTVVADIPEAPVVEAQPAAEPAVAEAIEEPAVVEPIAEAPAVETEALTPGVALSHSGTAGNFDPRAQYHIVNYRVIGYGENNGGIFNNGGQHMIFVNVVDENGNGVDGAVVKDAVNNKIAVVTGTKGPGRAEFEMFGEKFKLYVASDNSGDVSSQISNQMDTVWPHIPDIIGKLGPVEEELSICPTPDIRCEPPFYRAHWSYEVTFQKMN